ncbi:MAG: 2-phospho-L-lactate guanylyltransferase [Betaproteobacteria bacterium]|nr:2-phospho-L-lactate guanylyltransferase [Betaproteobacteria bacterium]
MRVLVPVKTPTRAKQRLAAILTLDERRELARAMALDLLGLLTSHPGIGPVVVCGNDASTEALARVAGVDYLPEAALGASGLSLVVNAAAARFAADAEAELLVIHGDVPLLSHAELERFLSAHRRADPHAVTIAPDRWHGGTNLLAWRPIAAFEVHYGVGSFQRHCDLARRSGASLAICELQGAGIDVDEPADLQAVLESAGTELAPLTQAFLSKSGVAPKLAELLRRQQGDASA